MPIVYNLDNLVGGEVFFIINGGTHRFLATFSGNDVAHYERIMQRKVADARRHDAEIDAIAAHGRAEQEAATAGLPPPTPLDQSGMGQMHPDFYPEHEYERDVFNLLLSVWTKSEATKPAHERITVTAESVRDLNATQAHTLLAFLFPLRGVVRVPPRAPQPPAPPAAPEAATSTASMPKRKRKPDTTSQD